MDVSTHRVRTKTARKAGSWGRSEVMSERNGKRGAPGHLGGKTCFQNWVERGLSNQATLLEQRRQGVWRNHGPGGRRLCLVLSGENVGWVGWPLTQNLGDRGTG